jgi:hypothetical protein
MINKKNVLRVLVLKFLLVVFYLGFYHTHTSKSESKEEKVFIQNNVIDDSNVRCQAYRQSCLDLYKRLRFPDPKYKFSPAAKDIPVELYENFTQHGFMPVTKYWYFNEVYADSFSEDKSKSTAVDVASFEAYREKVRNWKPLGYEDTSFHVLLDGYKEKINSKSIVSLMY